MQSLFYRSVVTGGQMVNNGAYLMLARVEVDVAQQAAPVAGAQTLPRFDAVAVGAAREADGLVAVLARVARTSVGER